LHVHAIPTYRVTDSMILLKTLMLVIDW